MADKKAPPPSFGQQFLDWWNAKPQAPVPYKVKGVPQRNQPANRQTLHRYAPAPYTSFGEIVSNVSKNIKPLDFVRDLAKGTYALGKTAVTDPGKLFQAGGDAYKSFLQVMAAAGYEKNGKWSSDIDNLMVDPKKREAWKREALQKYRSFASNFSYIKDGKRVRDDAAIARTLSQNPMEVFATINPGVRLANSNLLKLGQRLGPVGKVLEATGEVADVVTNPAPFLINQTVKAATPVVNAGLRSAGVRPTVFTRSGEYTPKMQQAFRDAGIDPALFNSPEMRKIVQDVINEKGISAAAIREATLRSQGVSPSRSMATGERSLAPDQERAFRAQAGQNLSQNMQDNVDAAYMRALSHQGVFTNTGDFVSGMRQSVEDALSEMGLSIQDVMTNSRFEEARRALQGSRGFPGVFDQFEDLAGIGKAGPVAPPKPLAVDFGGTHTFDYDKGYWVDPNGAPVTKPRVIDALDNISDRKNIPPPAAPAPPAQGPNRLTPQNIDSVRRNVSSRFNKAEGDDAAALAAINRGIDNYMPNNAANFTGDAVGMARDWQNARRTSQLARGYGNPPAPDPFAPPRQPTAYDPNAVARTEAARGIVQDMPELTNTTPPTIWQKIKNYTPSVGTGQLIGYNFGQGLGDLTGIPGAGLIAGSVTGAATKAARDKLDNMAAMRIAKSESAGAPRSPLFTAPDVRIPVSLAGGIATAAQSDYQTPVEAAPLPKAPAPAQAPRSTLLPDEISYEQYQKSYGQESPKAQEAAPMLPGEVSYDDYQKSLQPQPQTAGGRSGYKAGGKVGGIEPLVQALMAKAKMAKKASNKATEPLLNERDDAIANALAVAQKAI